MVLLPILRQLFQDSNFKLTHTHSYFNPASLKQAQIRELAVFPSLIIE